MPGKADYASALQLSFSPASPPAPLQCLARPGGTGGPLAEGGGSWEEQTFTQGLAQALHIPVQPILGNVQNPKRNLASNSIPRPPSLPGRLLALLAPFFTTHPQVSQGVSSLPPSPHPWWVLSPSPGCGTEKTSLGGSLCFWGTAQHPQIPLESNDDSTQRGKDSAVFCLWKKYRQ